MLEEIETLNRVVAKHKTSKAAARGFLSFFKTFSFIREGKDMTRKAVFLFIFDKFALIRLA